MIPTGQQVEVLPVDEVEHLYSVKARSSPLKIEPKAS